MYEFKLEASGLVTSPHALQVSSPMVDVTLPLPLPLSPSLCV